MSTTLWRPRDRTQTNLWVLWWILQREEKVSRWTENSVRPLEVLATDWIESSNLCPLKTSQHTGCAWLRRLAGCNSSSSHPAQSTPWPAAPRRRQIESGSAPRDGDAASLLTCYMRMKTSRQFVCIHMRVVQRPANLVIMGWLWMWCGVFSGITAAVER